ncbi:hypothetical protein AAEJ74_03450 [Limnospira fusiformis PMC 851.14]|uniref:Uncharacterized protein n=1 Tax=Limnospira fusiformis PMC 851.14 TaxID=2219512 RepID=A0ABU9EHM2_LIMFS
MNKLYIAIDIWYNRSKPIGKKRTSASNHSYTFNTPQLIQPILSQNMTYNC